LLPYGLAFFFALLCAAAGLYAFFVTGASYQNIFSSFVRATSGHDVHQFIDAESDGADPLPSKLAKATVVMGLYDEAWHMKRLCSAELNPSQQND
jgi:hypothetical protein